MTATRMRLFRRRRKQVVRSDPGRANPITVAVLEYDLLGIKPEAGSPAAGEIAARNRTCHAHRQVEISVLGTLWSRHICADCGKHLTQDDNGEWRLA